MWGSRPALRTRKRLHAGALTLLRVCVGGIMMAHGWMKLADIDAAQQSFAALGIPAPEVMVPLAIAGELFGGLGVVLGCLTPIAAFGIACTMVGAIAFVHLDNGLFAQKGGFEYPLVMLMAALYFVVRGAGPFSVDAWLAARRRAPPRSAPVLGQDPAQVTV
jgi:putative oxidoreductase